MEFIYTLQLEHDGGTLTIGAFYNRETAYNYSLQYPIDPTTGTTIRVLKVPIKDNKTARREMAVGLTKKQQQVYAYIVDYIKKENGVCPSYEDIMYYMGWKSKSGVHRVIKALEERGLLSKPKGHRRFDIPYVEVNYLN